MTQIDFYILGATPNATIFTCKLVDKVYHLSHSIYVHTNSAEQAQAIDDLLWTFNQGSFLPHELVDSTPTNSPILIGHGHNPSVQTDVMINLSGKVPSFFSQFDRVAEIVQGDESQRQTARENYKFYKERGYNINTHDIQ